MGDKQWDVSKKFANWMMTEEGRETLNDSRRMNAPILPFSPDNTVDEVLERVEGEGVDSILAVYNGTEGFVLFHSILLGYQLPYEKKREEESPSLAVGFFFGTEEGLKFLDSYPGGAIQPTHSNDYFREASEKINAGILAAYDEDNFSFLKLSRLKNRG